MASVQKKRRINIKKSKKSGYTFYDNCCTLIIYSRKNNMAINLLLSSYFEKLISKYLFILK